MAPAELPPSHDTKHDTLWCRRTSAAGVPASLLSDRRSLGGASSRGHGVLQSESAGRSQSAWSHSIAGAANGYESKLWGRASMTPERGVEWSCVQERPAVFDQIHVYYRTC